MSDSNKENKIPSQGAKRVISEESKKIGSFFNFDITEAKFKEVQKRSKVKLIRYVLTGFVFGFCTEYMLGCSKIYSNIITKSTMRRLNAKKREDQRIEQRQKLRQLMSKTGGIQKLLK